MYKVNIWQSIFSIGKLWLSIKLIFDKCTQGVPNQNSFPCVRPLSDKLIFNFTINSSFCAIMNPVFLFWGLKYIVTLSEKQNNIAPLDRWPIP